MAHRLRYLFVLSLVLLAGCRTQSLFLTPPPSEMEGVEGYASLRITAGQQSARTRFSFLFQLPAEGRLDVLDPLGRVPYQILIVERRSFFVVPSRKAYWEGEEEAILEKFLGFRLSLLEVVALISGHWPGMDQGETPDWQEGWVLEKDRRDRIHFGRRGDFAFNVEEFFGQSPWVKTAVFHHVETEGRLKILDIQFNQPPREGAFSTAFLDQYSRKTWEEIQEMLSDAR